MTIRYVIIEDEMAAYHLLSGQLKELRPEAEIIGPLQTIDEAVEYFTNEPLPEMAFVDIHLADGSSFAIFDQVDVQCPIVFITAYDQYALRAFDVNCIDYLLKPIDKTKLERALGKHDLLSRNKVEKIKQEISAGNQLSQYDSCLLIHQRDKIIPVPTSEIAVIYLADQIMKLKTFNGESYYLNTRLEETYAKLDPSRFFRANRQYIIARGAIKDVTMWFGNKLSVNLKIQTEQRIIISKVKVPEFKAWLTKTTV